MFKKFKRAFLSTALIGTCVTPLSVLSCSFNFERNSFNWAIYNEKISYLNVKSPIGKFETQNKLADLEGIDGDGSSSVLPVMSRIMPAIKNMQYEGNGSGEGLNTALALAGNGGAPNTHEFGMTSSMKNPPTGKKWTNIRTVTWAVDAIGIALNLPLGIYIKDNKRPQINIVELAKLYAKEVTATSTWGKLLLNADLTKSKPSALAKTPVIFGRQGGKSASGTADGFWHTLSKYMPAGTTADLNHTNIAKKGGETTAESNAAALNAIRYKPGAITYLSLGYGVQNQSRNMVLATVVAPKDMKNPKGSTVAWEPTFDNVKDGNYNWRRPFNILYSVAKDSSGHIKDPKPIEFVNLLLSTEGQQALTEQGFVPLSPAQMQQEFLKKGTTISKDPTQARAQILPRLAIPDSQLVNDVYNDNLGLQL